jgi:hypothetical protein
MVANNDTKMKANESRTYFALRFHIPFLNPRLHWAVTFQLAFSQAQLNQVPF